MRRFKVPLIIFITLLAIVVIFGHQRTTNINIPTKTEVNSTKPLIKNSPNKAKNQHSHSHSHSHHHDESTFKPPQSNLAIQNNYQIDDNSKNNKIYKNQIDHFKRTYFRHLSKKVKVKVSVKKVLKETIVLLVRTKVKTALTAALSPL